MEEVGIDPNDADKLSIEDSPIKGSDLATLTKNRLEGKNGDCGIQVGDMSKLLQKRAAETCSGYTHTRK